MEQMFVTEELIKICILLISSV